VVTEPQRYRLSVKQYDRAVDAGTFRNAGRLELLDGELIEMPPQKAAHASAVRALMKSALAAGVVADAILVQMPFVLDPHSEPEPDFVVVRGPADQYRRRHPRAKDVLLLVEVSDTSRDYDRRRKLPRYAAARIAEVWLVDLQDEIVQIHRQPRAGAYRIVEIARRGDDIQAQFVPGFRATVDEILGPAE
jgi:Uma2 family endonuclease